jgi:hypothetical protein
MLKQTQLPNPLLRVAQDGREGHEGYATTAFYSNNNNLEISNPYNEEVDFPSK